MNKKQHWVPAWLLSRFSLTPEHGRNAQLHVHDGKNAFIARVGDLCAARDFYSKSEAHADRSSKRLKEFQTHGVLDSALKQAVQGFERGERKPVRLLTLLNLCSYLSLRGPRFQCEDDRLDAAQSQGIPYLLRYFFGLNRPALGTDMRGEVDECLMLLAREWDFHLIRAAPVSLDPDLMFSDNPVMLFGTPAGLELLLLPLARTEVLVACRTDKVTVTLSEYTTEDAGMLNAMQASFAVRQVYSANAFSASDANALARYMSRQLTPDSSIRSSEFECKTYGVPTTLPSFIRARI